MSRGLLTPRDLRTLGKKDEYTIADDTMALSVQCAASIAKIGAMTVGKEPRSAGIDTSLG